MRILQRLVLGFGCVVAVSAVQFSFNIFSIRHLGQETLRASTVPVVEMDAARTATAEFAQANNELTEVLQHVQYISSRDALTSFLEHTKKIRSALSRLQAAATTEAVAVDAGAAIRAVQRWETAATALIASEPRTSVPAPHQLVRMRDRVHSSLQTVVGQVKLETANSIEVIKSSTSAAIYFAILSAIAALLIGVVASVSTGLSLTRPLARVQQRMKGLMAGEATSDVPHVDLKNEIGEMARAVQVFQATSLERAALNREAHLLSQLTEWLQSCKSMNELYGMVGQFLSKLLPDCPGSLYIYANSRDVLESVEAWNGDQPVAAMHPDDCWGLRRGRTYTYGETEFDFRCSHSEHSSISHYCCVPILAHGETIGLLHIDLSQGHEGCSQDQIDKLIAARKKLALLCAEQISLAIANAKLRDELQDQSIRDALTGMYNRRYALETCRREFARATRAQHSVSILSLDVDHFKKFNDNHGHDAGDTVLRSVADCLIESFRDDDVASRFGGEEFVVILPNATKEQAATRAEQVRAQIEGMQVRYLDSNLPRVSVSIGIAAFPDHGKDPTVVLRAADEALYDAKNGGRNTVVVAQSTRERSVASDHPVGQLQDAIAVEFEEHTAEAVG